MIESNKCLLENEKKYMPGDDFGETTEKPKLLLHSCCGPCSTAVIERLTDEFDVTVFFYNPCITEEKEYQLRRSAQLQYLEKFNEENAGVYQIFWCPQKPLEINELRQKHN